MWDFLGSLGDWASQLGVDVIAFLQWMMAALIAVFQYLYALIAAVFQYLWGLLKTVGDFFKTIWETVYKNILVPIYNALVKVHQWLESVLSPVVHFLQSVRNFLNRWFLTYIKPIITIISTLRKFLEVLRSFGIKWAGTLDKLLGQIQSDITKTFQKVQGYLNSVINIVNALADPLGLFRRPTLVMSMRRIFPSFMKGVTGMPLGYLFPTPRKNAGRGLGATPFPFNSKDTTQNPPASSYFSGDDGLGDFAGFDLSTTPPDDAVDRLDPLDFFNDDAYDDPVYADATQGADDLMSTILDNSFVQS